MNFVLKYRKKPVVVEAMEFRTNNEPEPVNMDAVVKWITDNGGSARHDGTDIYIRTLESGDGAHIASCGDFIIRGIKGEFYPCKPDIFHATYDLEPPVA